MEMIDVLPPGLYEAVITEVDEKTINPDLVYPAILAAEVWQWTPFMRSNYYG